MSRKLLKSTAVVSSMTFISRIMGLVRDVVFARMFGAGPGMDAFFVAFKIPNFFRRLFAEGAFTQAFVPVLTDYKTNRPGEVSELVSRVSGTLAVFLFVLTVLGIIIAPLLIGLFASGFIGAEDGRYPLAVDMLRITFPYLLFISLTACAGGILNSYGAFAAPAFTPVFLNLSLIAAAIWLAPNFERPVVALAWGVFAAGVVQLLFQFPFLRRLGLLTRPRWGRSHEGVGRIMRLMLPGIIASSSVQIGLLVDTVIASHLQKGSVSWLYYSDRLVEFPLGVFGIAIATVILPSLSSRHAEAAPEQFTRTLDWGLRWAFVIGVPATVALFILAGPALATLFQYGQFDGGDVQQASMSLMAYSFGLMGFILVKVLVPGYFARQDTKTPMRISITAVLSNVAMNFLFVVPLVLVGFGSPHAGLALATSAAAYVNCGLLFRGLRRAGVYRASAGWRRFAVALVLANAVMAGFLWWYAGDLSTWLAQGVAWRVTHLTVLVLGGGALYLAALAALGVRPWRWRVAEA